MYESGDGHLSDGDPFYQKNGEVENHQTVFRENHDAESKVRRRTRHTCACVCVCVCV